MRARSLLLAGAVALLGAAAALGTWRVALLEELELEAESETTLGDALEAPDATEASARLATVSLRRGEEAVFELCSDDSLAPARWASTMEIAVWNPEAQELLARTPLDEETLEHARRNRAGACLTIARGLVPSSGDYAVEAVFEPPLRADLLSTPLRVRTLGRVPLGPLERTPVVLAVLGAFLVVLSLAATSARSDPRAAIRDEAPVTVISRLAMGIGLVLAAAAALAAMPFTGSAASLVTGLLFAGTEVLAALAFVPRGDGTLAARLGIVRPHRGVVPIVVTTVVGAALLVVIARAAVSWVPSTSEAPIQTFVSWPSGLLSFALLAALVPVAEELFFRGFVYGAAQRFGSAAAFVLSAGLFVAAHAPQVWGGWGGLLAVTCTGLGLTALRAWSGSVLPGAAVHVAYNALLAASAVF